MSEKLSLYNIAELLAVKTGVETADVEKFIIELITLVNEGIREDGIVKIKGFGTFKIILVKERESVHINTGERIVIPAHHKLSFKPEEELKELINQPFSIFETIEAIDENLKTTLDLSLSEINEGMNETGLISSQPLVSDYRIVDDEPEQDSFEDENEEADIIPPAGIPTMDQEKETLPVKTNKGNISSLQEDELLTNIDTSGSEDNEISLQANHPNQKEEFTTPLVPNQQPTKSKNNHIEKKKRKTSSLVPLYFVLILLVFVLAGCIWYYFAYSRSFDSYNQYNTKVSNNTFALPGDSVSEQQTSEEDNILYKDTINASTNPEAGLSDSDLQSGGSSANNETTTSNPAGQPEISIPKSAAATKKPSATGTNNADKVLAKVKMESGNRLTLIAEKYYGNKIFWVYIYDFNKEKIGTNPDNIKIGMEIQVPTKETYGIDSNNVDSVEKARRLQAQLMAGKK